jgi:hypothetical protein
MAPRIEPTGKLSNRPIAVPDTLEAIVAALGGDVSMLEGVEVAETGANVPVREY